MLGQVNTNEDDDTEELQGDDVEDNLGLAEHILKKNKIELAARSKVATKEELEKYKERFADKANNPCEIDLDEHGNIVLHYTKGTSPDGCTVDLLSSIDKKIEFN